MRVVDKIKEKIDIVEYIKDFVEIKPTGKNFKGICPFHNEKTPSMVVSPDRQIFHCFGCLSGGDVIGFVMKYENVEFIEALKILADKAGISLQEFGSVQEKKYTALYEVNRIAKEYFSSLLQTDNAKSIKKYLINRGLSEEIIDEFEIGVASSNLDALTRHLVKMSFSVTEADKAGLSFKTKRGMYMDRFRERIIFPIHNHFGKVIAFTGRIIPGVETDMGKYVNSPETPIFNKSRVLYGFFKSKQYIREEDSVVLVEGQMDFLACWFSGVKNVAASSGTALTISHLEVLKKLTNNLILFYDNDKAGKMATEKSIDLAQAMDFNVKVVIQPSDGAKDPSDLALESQEKLKQVVTFAKPAMEYYLSQANLSSLDIQEKKQGIRFILEKINKIQSPVEASHWLKELSKMSGVDESILDKEIQFVKKNEKLDKTKEEIKQNITDQPVSRVDRIAQRILSLVVFDKEGAGKLITESKESFPEKYKEVLEYMVSEGKTEPKSEITGLVNLINLRTAIEPINEDSYLDELKELLIELKKENLLYQKARIRAEIKKAEAQADTVKLDELLKEFHELTRDEG
ncbi:MAG: DNA primase [Candidatus Harrisonbacteria bacterium CG10_big_fil_rev_8_21_14_0_10_38_8]|uniref:DNA primase n=1 Tax=Candidatus Harrisonbacteria bacterium CG10_big_fil_rev_8_21_14_0_10_38_8 TaxID=1974582 RepID=A0A2M6WJX2_9BACT|nr:MAG: DNA primase [Candidatus Harrisonbacteria bacterium CG10_big_fil_rev_8_21_14_0_10_38_8]